MPRGPKLSEELRIHIRNRWIYGHMSAPEIAEEIQTDRTLRSKYGKVDEQSVYYHINKIKSEVNKLNDGDAIERYRTEFYRLQETMDQEVADLNTMIKESGDKDLKLRLMRMRHDILMDKIRVLGDKEVPLQLKMIQDDYNRKHPKLKKAEPEQDPPKVEFKSA